MEEKKIQDRPRGPGEGIWRAPVGHVAHWGVSLILGVPPKTFKLLVTGNGKTNGLGLGVPIS